jgi:hypothetical protein
MHSRRLTSDIRLSPTRLGRRRSVYRTLSLPRKGRKVLGPDLKCSESCLGAAVPIRRIARQGTAGDRCTAGFRSSRCPKWVNSVIVHWDDAVAYVRFCPKADTAGRLDEMRCAALFPSMTLTGLVIDKAPSIKM